MKLNKFKILQKIKNISNVSDIMVPHSMEEFKRSVLKNCKQKANP